jgi:hypothetical protein
VLDDVERRRFLVEPARKDPAPFLVRLLDVDLDERTGQLFFFPRRRRLARAQPNDHVLPAHRLAGMKRDRLHDAVALVEHAEHCDALRHRRHAALPVCGRRSLLGRRQRRVSALLALAARSERKRSWQKCSDGAHAYSGIHGS